MQSHFATPATLYGHFQCMCEKRHLHPSPTRFLVKSEGTPYAHKYGNHNLPLLELQLLPHFVQGKLRLTEEEAPTQGSTTGCEAKVAVPRAFFHFFQLSFVKVHRACHLPWDPWLVVAEEAGMWQPSVGTDRDREPSWRDSQPLATEGKTMDALNRTK